MKIKKQAFISPSITIEEDFRIFYYSDIKSKRLQPHYHDFYEMYLLISGKIAYNTEGNTFFIKPGDILFLNVKQSHYPVLIDPNIPYERIALQISPKTLAELSDFGIDLAECFTRDNYAVYHFPKDVLNNIRMILGKLLFLQQTPQFGSKLLARACLIELFVEINQYNHDKSIYTLSSEVKDSQFLALVKQYINEQLTEDITIEKLSAYVCMSKYHFMHTFKRLTGMSTYQYILMQRLNAACDLIGKGIALTNVYQQCGFKDYSSFYRAFCKHYGKSPSKHFLDIKEKAK